MKMMIAGLLIVGGFELLCRHASRLYWQKDIMAPVDKLMTKLYNIITD